MNELPSSGLDKLAPADGAFYIYADIAHFTNDSVEFCKRMLEEIGAVSYTHLTLPTILRV